VKPKPDTSESWSSLGLEHLVQEVEASKTITRCPRFLFAVETVFNGFLAANRGLTPDLHVFKKGRQTLKTALRDLENVWLRDPGPFVVGRSKPSIADLSIVCELMQLEVSTEICRRQVALYVGHRQCEYGKLDTGILLNTRHEAIRQMIGINKLLLPGMAGVGLAFGQKLVDS
jgi:hypothetical protein